MQAQIIKHTVLFSIFVLLAQITGLGRDLYLARFFGVGPILDVYYFAFKVPDFLNVFYSVFLGSVIFIPLLTKAYNDDGDREMVKKVNTLGSLVLTFVISFGVLLFVFMPEISKFLAPNFSDLQIQEMIKISRILIFAQFFFPIGILGGSLGMVKGKPFGMAISGFIYNFIILLVTVLFARYFGIYATVYGVVFGAICFALVQTFPTAGVREILKHFKFEINWSEWREFLFKNLGRFVAVLLYQLFSILLLYFAGLTGPSGVSIFSISYNLFLALFFILGASLSTALMPKVSQMHVQGKFAEQKEQLNNSLIYISYISIVTTILALIFKFDIVKFLYFFSHIGLDKEVYISQIFAMLMLSFFAFNCLEIIRKYLYSTNQINLAGALTSFLIIFISLINFGFLKIVGFVSLYDLCVSFFIATFISLIIMLIILQIKKQINLLTIFLNTYKIFFICLVTFIISGYLKVDLGNFILSAILNALIYMHIIFGLVLLTADKIGKNILRQTMKIVIK